MRLSIRALCEKFLQSKEEHKLISFFKSVELFKNFSVDEIFSFIESVPISRREYAAGELIFHEGQGGVSMYFVLEGRVRIYKNYGKEDEIKLADLGKGGLFGEISMLRETPRTATVIAMEPTVLLAVAQSDIEEFMNTHPDIAYKLVRNFASKIAIDLENSNKRQEELEHKILELSSEIKELQNELQKCREKLKKLRQSTSSSEEE